MLRHHLPAPLPLRLPAAASATRVAAGIISGSSRSPAFGTSGIAANSSDNVFCPSSGQEYNHQRYQHDRCPLTDSETYATASPRVNHFHDMCDRVERTTHTSTVSSALASAIAASHACATLSNDLPLPKCSSSCSAVAPRGPSSGAQYQSSTTLFNGARVPAISLSCSIPITASTRPFSVALSYAGERYSAAMDYARHQKITRGDSLTIWKRPGKIALAIPSRMAFSLTSSPLARSAASAVAAFGLGQAATKQISSSVP